MTAAGPNDLARALRAFFADHLPRVRGTSPHTIQSYRDSLVLLLRFVATETQRSVLQLDLDDLAPQPILAFLQYLELDRRNRSRPSLRRPSAAKPGSCSSYIGAIPLPAARVGQPYSSRFGQCRQYCGMLSAFGGRVYSGGYAAKHHL